MTFSFSKGSLYSVFYIEDYGGVEFAKFIRYSKTTTIYRVEWMLMMLQ